MNVHSIERVPLSEEAKGGNSIITGSASSQGSTSSAVEQTGVMECSVCLQPYIHPVELPCRHIFCFLCVKGVANRSKRCALCRQEIPQEFFNNPKLVKDDDLQKTPSFEGGYQWFYEGRNGWWQYDERTSVEMERCKDSTDKTVDLLIAGFLYVVDFENMIQYRRNDPTRRRRIKRDLVDIPEKKGVAGLKIDARHISRRTAPRGQESSSVPPGQQVTMSGSVIPSAEITSLQSSSVLAVARNSVIIRNGNEQSPPPPSNTPQSPAASSAGSSPTLAPLEQELSTIVTRLDISLDIPSGNTVSVRNEMACYSGPLSSEADVTLNPARNTTVGTASVDDNINLTVPEDSRRRHHHRRRHSNGETQTHDVQNNNTASDNSRNQTNHDGTQIYRRHPSYPNTRARSRSVRSTRDSLELN